MAKKKSFVVQVAKNISSEDLLMFFAEGSTSNTNDFAMEEREKKKKKFIFLFMFGLSIVTTFFIGIQQENVI